MISTQEVIDNINVLLSELRNKKCSNIKKDVHDKLTSYLKKVSSECNIDLKHNIETNFIGIAVIPNALDYESYTKLLGIDIQIDADNTLKEIKAYMYQFIAIHNQGYYTNEDRKYFTSLPIAVYPALLQYCKACYQNSLLEENICYYQKSIKEKNTCDDSIYQAYSRINTNNNIIRYWKQRIDSIYPINNTQLNKLKMTNKTILEKLFTIK